ncbi:MAG: sigma-70 family RNA polymerase sigma factor [archaeon]
MNKKNREERAEKFLPLIHYILREHGIRRGNPYRDNYFEAGLVGLAKALNGYDGRVTFLTYAYSCIENEVLNEAVKYWRGKEKMWRTVRGLDCFLWGIVADGGDSPYDKVEREEDISLLMRLVDELPSRSRKIIRLRCEGMTFNEIAEVVGRDSKKVGGHAIQYSYARSLKKLRRMFEREVGVH